jgi:hypothetical protein
VILLVRCSPVCPTRTEEGALAYPHLNEPKITLIMLCVLMLGAGASAQFETRGRFAAQEFPRAIAVGDFNHDGKLDLAVTSDCCGLSILLGRGDGTFQPATQYVVGDGPFSIVAVDLNHDGNLDLAVANHLSPYLSILMGRGDGTFEPATQSPPVPDDAVFVGAGDFNGDGIPDLVTLGGSPTINVFLGNGDGTFQNAVGTEPSFAVGAIGVGDFNGDGLSDLATAGQFGFGTGVNILLGNGDGTFRVGANYPGDREPVSIAVADFNGDHNLDFAVANLEGVGIGVFLGNGDGTFQPGVNYATSFPTWVTAADLNASGKIDLAVANSEGGASVLLGNGDGTFQPGAFYPGGSWSVSVAPGDFNGDGKTDLMIADHLYDFVIELLNTGVVSFSPTSPLYFNQAAGGTSAPQEVVLTNTGSARLRIASMKASREFGLGTTCKKTVAAGAKCSISVTFSPRKQGPVKGTLTILDSASSKPQVIELVGTGT